MYWELFTVTKLGSDWHVLITISRIFPMQLADLLSSTASLKKWNSSSDENFPLLHGTKSFKSLLYRYVKRNTGSGISLRKTTRVESNFLVSLLRPRNKLYESLFSCRDTLKTMRRVSSSQLWRLRQRTVTWSSWQGKFCCLNLTPFVSILSYLYLCGSGSVFWMWIRIHKAPEYGTDPIRIRIHNTGL